MLNKNTCLADAVSSRLTGEAKTLLDEISRDLDAAGARIDYRDRTTTGRDFDEIGNLLQGALIAACKHTDINQGFIDYLKKNSSYGHPR